MIMHLTRPAILACLLAVSLVGQPAKPNLALAQDSMTQACQEPPSDYTRIDWNGNTLNRRTWWMLNLAAVLYQGPGDILRVTQGSYTGALAASFGTHAGGGAVDISVRAKDNPNIVLSVEAAADMAWVLRLAGFAAWVRLPGDLKSTREYHIHAIAVGDQELSPAASRQLTGPEGYFRGMDGVPVIEGGPHPDRLSGQVLCRWMLDLGYHDYRLRYHNPRR